MSIIAKHIAGVRGSETKAMTARAAALRSQGRSIITLSQGEPDFETPSHVRAAACRAIDEGKTRYTAVAGIQALRESIVAKLERDNGLHFTPDQVTVGCGAKQVIFNAWLGSLDPGDEVIIPTPCWVSYPEMVRLLLKAGASVHVTLEDVALRNVKRIECVNVDPAAVPELVPPRIVFPPRAIAIDGFDCVDCRVELASPLFDGGRMHGEPVDRQPVSG